MKRGDPKVHGDSPTDERRASTLFILALLANIPLGILINLASSNMPAWTTPIVRYPWFALIAYSAVVVYIGIRSRKVSLGPVGALLGLDRADLHRLHVKVGQYADEILAGEATRQAVIPVRLQFAENMAGSLRPTFARFVEDGMTTDRILDVFDSAGRNLLIVGQPGAGKTRLLACLAKALITRASKNKYEPSPIIANLSSWRPGYRFEPWLVSQIEHWYLIRREVASRMVVQQKISVLLDGLDENPNIKSCLEEINRFRRRRKLDMVICCRESECRELSRLDLRAAVGGAIVVPLPDDDEIKKYLETSGVPAEASSIVLRSSRDDLIRSPLMLKVISRLSISAGGPVGLVAATPELRQKTLFDAYINELLVHPRDPHTASNERSVFNLNDTMRWLVSLACAMRSKGTTEMLSSSPWLPYEVEAQIDSKEWPLGLAYSAVFSGVLSYFFLQDLRELLHSVFFGIWAPRTWIVVGVSFALFLLYVKDNFFFRWWMLKIVGTFILGFIVVSFAALFAVNPFVAMIVGGVAGILVAILSQLNGSLYEEEIYSGWALAFIAAIFWAILPKYRGWRLVRQDYIHMVSRLLSNPGHGNERLSPAVAITVLIALGFLLIMFSFLFMVFPGLIPYLILQGAKRTTLAVNRYGPWRYERFINYLRERGILIKSGHSLQFGHPLLLDHLASRRSSQQP